jgi:hypothetical protein
MNLAEELYAVVRKAVADELDDRAGGKNAPPTPELERLPDAAKRFSVSVSFLEARVAEGTLAMFGAGKMRRVRPADVAALIRRRGVAAVESPAEKAEQILRRLPGGKGR